MQFVMETEADDDDIIVLKNCPFCGGKAKTHMNLRTIGHGEVIKEFYITCANCGVQGPRYHEPYYILTDNIIKIIANLWNHRV